MPTIPGILAAIFSFDGIEEVDGAARAGRDLAERGRGADGQRAEEVLGALVTHVVTTYRRVRGRRYDGCLAETECPRAVVRSVHDARGGRRVRPLAAGLQAQGHRGAPAWYVDDRLVARLVDPGELVVRASFAGRERLVADHPETFGVPPRYEKHYKVQALLSGDATAICAAIRAAWELQRR